MKRILLMIVALAMVALMTVPAMAEVQNIKVSGGVDVYGVTRDNYTPAGSSGARAITGFSECQDSRDFYMTSAYLNVEADLTDNVTATLQTGTEWDWAAAGASNVVELWQGYVTMAEMLYSPLTVRVGRMPVQLADGLIIGDGTVFDDGTILADELSNHNSFDTIHGILDYDPLTIIAGTLKIADQADNAAAAAEIDGYLLDAIYKFEDDMNTVLDVYFVTAHYGANQAGYTGPFIGANTKSADVNALAVCVTLDPMEGLMTKFGLALQTGDYSSTATTARSLDAMAFDIDLNYSIDNEYAPTVGLEYIYRSGPNATNEANNTGDYEGWLPLFENQENGKILDPNTNISAIALKGSVMPADRLTVGAEFWLFAEAEETAASATAGTKKDDDLGTELDLYANYAYTEDVDFGLSLAWFFPGSHYDTVTTGSATYDVGNKVDETAMEAILSTNIRF